MPIGNYSYSGSGDQRPIAITEPGDHGRSRCDAGRSSDSEESQGIMAKEPDRQGTTRRATQSNRSRTGMAADNDQQSETRARGTQKGNARRGGAQARRATERGGPAARRSAGPETKSRQKKSRRGFAAMSSDQQREIARKGGLTVSRNRRHMADIGRIGGEHSHGGRRARR